MVRIPSFGGLAGKLTGTRAISGMTLMGLSTLGDKVIFRSLESAADYAGHVTKTIIGGALTALGIVKIRAGMGNSSTTVAASTVGMRWLTEGIAEWIEKGATGKILAGGMPGSLKELGDGVKLAALDVKDKVVRGINKIRGRNQISLASIGRQIDPNRDVRSQDLGLTAGSRPFGQLARDFRTDDDNKRTKSY